MKRSAFPLVGSIGSCATVADVEGCAGATELPPVEAWPIIGEDPSDLDAEALEPRRGAFEEVDRDTAFSFGYMAVCQPGWSSTAT